MLYTLLPGANPLMDLFPGARPSWFLFCKIMFPFGKAEQKLKDFILVG